MHVRVDREALGGRTALGGDPPGQLTRLGGRMGQWQDELSAKCQKREKRAGCRMPAREQVRSDVKGAARHGNGCNG